MAPKYRFEYNPGFRGRFPVDAGTIGRELGRLKDENPEGKLVAEEVWRANRRKGAPLHDCYEWNVQKAAEICWTETSRHIIRSVRVVPIPDESQGATVKPKPFRPYVSLDNDYHDVRDVMENAGLRQQLLAKAMREAEAWMLRYQNLAELSVVFEVIRSLLDELMDEID